MGSSGIDEEEKEESTSILPKGKTLESIYEKQFPFFLSIGMTYEQYWNDDPTLVIPYLEAFDLKRKRKNQEMWLQGLYVYKAIGSFAEIFVGLPAKNAKVQDYMKEPLPLTKEEVELREKKAQKEKFDKIMEKFISMSNPYSQNAPNNNDED